MGTKIFVNLPVRDLPRSVAFFQALGYGFNAQFTNDTAACMVVAEDIAVMLLTEARFKDFTPKSIADASRTTEVLTCLSAESREAVDALADKALAAGGTQVMPPMDYGFMYGRSFNDLDGHIWEIMWMDQSAIPSG